MYRIAPNSTSLYRFSKKQSKLKYLKKSRNCFQIGKQFEEYKAHRARYAIIVNEIGFFTCLVDDIKSLIF